MVGWRIARAGDFSNLFHHDFDEPVNAGSTRHSGEDPDVTAAAIAIERYRRPGSTINAVHEVFAARLRTPSSVIDLDHDGSSAVGIDVVGTSLGITNRQDRLSVTWIARAVYDEHAGAGCTFPPTNTDEVGLAFIDTHLKVRGVAATSTAVAVARNLTQTSTVTGVDSKITVETHGVARAHAHRAGSARDQVIPDIGITVGHVGTGALTFIHRHARGQCADRIDVPTAPGDFPSRFTIIVVQRLRQVIHIVHRKGSQNRLGVRSAVVEIAIIIIQRQPVEGDRRTDIAAGMHGHRVDGKRSNDVEALTGEGRFNQFH